MTKNVQTETAFDQKYTFNFWNTKKYEDKDTYIVGSDQVWNKNILGGEYDPVYFLDLNSCSQKYSYAVSAEDDLPFDDIKKIKYMTQSFLEVSVREFVISSNSNERVITFWRKVTNSS